MLLSLWFSGLLLFSDISPADTVLLATNIPASSNDSSRQQIDCIMQQTRQPYQLLIMPWRRAKQEVKMGRVDGYFTAIPNATVDEYARLSTPLFLENWYWFWRTNGPAVDSGQKLRFGAILGSHQADWFAATGNKLDLEVGDIAQLVQLLAIGRIDALLADLDDFNHTASRLKLPAELFQQRFFRYVPLGVYFSQQRLQQRPGFIRHFNAAAHLCSAEPFALATVEQQQLLALLYEDLRTLAASPQLQQAVQHQNAREMQLETILQHDNLWQQQLQHPTPDNLAQQLLQTAESERLRQWQAIHPALVTEVILMDKHGANVALSQLTTDYWQGDETPFLSVFEQPLEYYIDVVEYDQSAQRFQVKLSVPVKNAQGYHIGALSIGVDVEQALRNE